MPLGLAVDGDDGCRTLDEVRWRVRVHCEDGRVLCLHGSKRKSSDGPNAPVFG